MKTLTENYDIQHIDTEPGTSGWTLMWTTRDGGLVTEHGNQYSEILKALDNAKSLDGSDFVIIFGDDIEIPE